MYRLPVSGIEVSLRQPAGAEDLLLCEAVTTDFGLALTLIERLASPTRDWSILCATDIEVFLLLLRRIMLGDCVQAETVCPALDCRTRVDVSFRVGDYLSHHRPTVPRGVERTTQGEWFCFMGQPTRFRLPLGFDLVASAATPDPEAELLRRCIDPAPVPTWVRHRIERAMESMAPSLSHAVKGRCPNCRSAIAAYFDVQGFVLRELRNRAVTVYRDIHLLASQYNWAEENILALPHNRRTQYAAMVAYGG